MKHEIYFHVSSTNDVSAMTNLIDDNAASCGNVYATQKKKTMGESLSVYSFLTVSVRDLFRLLFLVPVSAFAF